MGLSGWRGCQLGGVQFVAAYARTRSMPRVPFNRTCRGLRGAPGRVAMAYLCCSLCPFSSLFFFLQLYLTCKLSPGLRLGQGELLCLATCTTRTPTTGDWSRLAHPLCLSEHVPNQRELGKQLVFTTIQQLNSTVAVGEFVRVCHLCHKLPCFRLLSDRV